MYIVSNVIIQFWHLNFLARWPIGCVQSLISFIDFRLAKTYRKLMEFCVWSLWTFVDGKVDFVSLHSSSVYLRISKLTGASINIGQEIGDTNCNFLSLFLTTQFWLPMLHSNCIPSEHDYICCKGILILLWSLLNIPLLSALKKK